MMEHNDTSISEIPSIAVSGINTFFLGVLTLIAVGAVLQELRSILLPFALAMVLSLLLKPLVAKMREYKVPSSLAILSALLVVAGVLSGMGIILTQGVQEIIAQAPRYQVRLEEIVRDMDSLLASMGSGTLASLSQEWTSMLNINLLTGWLTKSVSSVFTALGNGVLILLYLIFLLSGSQEFSSKIQNAFPDQRAERVRGVLFSINTNIRKYMAMKTLINIGTGGTVWLILASFGVDFALFLGVTAAIMNYIPNIGSFIATALPALVLLVQMDSLAVALLVIAMLIVAQSLIGNVVEPLVLEKSLNLSPLVILISLIFWGWLWGIVGMILAVPLTSMAKIVCEEVPPLRPIAVLMSRSATGREPQPTPVEEI